MLKPIRYFRTYQKFSWRYLEISEFYIFKVDNGDSAISHHWSYDHCDYALFGIVRVRRWTEHGFILNNKRKIGILQEVTVIFQTLPPLIKINLTFVKFLSAFQAEMFTDVYRGCNLPTYIINTSNILHSSLATKVNKIKQIRQENFASIKEVTEGEEMFGGQLIPKLQSLTLHCKQLIHTSRD